MEWIHVAYFMSTIVMQSYYKTKMLKKKFNNTSIDIEGCF